MRQSLEKAVKVLREQCHAGDAATVQDLIEMLGLPATPASAVVRKDRIRQDVDDVHSCSYYCKRPACIKTQRDQFVQQLDAGREATLEYRAMNPLGGPAKLFDAVAGSIRGGDSVEAAMRAYGVQFVPDATPVVAVAAADEDGPALVDFEAGLDGDQPAEAMRRWNAFADMVTALRFYADASNYLTKSTGFEAQYDPARPRMDGGQRARAVLAKAGVT